VNEVSEVILFIVDHVVGGGNIGGGMINKPSRSTVGLTALWDPWGLFFIHLTHESGISDHKSMNSGWMKLG
jgi:hypothetical protein